MLESYVFSYVGMYESVDRTMPIIGALVYMSDIDRYGRIVDTEYCDETYGIAVLEDNEFIFGQTADYDDSYDNEYRYSDDFDICVGVDEDGHYYWANGRTVEKWQQLDEIDEQEQQLAEQRQQPDEQKDYAFLYI